ncbi:hypothetical protein FAZ19_23040 [Sphingobacterium alkalisoli]|uniref:Peptidase S24/S26A/S26B/S26C domain-containing protein n=1 Tax=Sphingobacterium alkalisoli TaxID=1874115 RepID=A0A4U0GMQ9_9SPHI|nr:S24/S26 family peptidase [Sphingobacterium alkalisoli]TJY60131.1 hypothetical protein FAZ19_23040 [Sphingobacterium alkalisoli]GGH32108.1 hypothetical protein GCM10011418_45410 [Sphingobacterium alkalisoli]
MKSASFKKLTVANSVFFDQVKEYLDGGKKVTIPVAGGSMRPFLRQGDKVVIKAIEPADMKLGRILLAYTPQGYVLHRLVRKTAKEVWLAGDANLQQLERIPKTALWAVVIEAYRGDKRKNPYALPTMLAAWLWYGARPLRRIIGKC